MNIYHQNGYRMELLINYQIFIILVYYCKFKYERYEMIIGCPPYIHKDKQLLYEMI